MPPERVGNSPLLIRMSNSTKLMLLNKTIQTLSVIALSLGALAPSPAQALTCSYASHYGIGDGYDGQRTANGERFNAYGNSAAHRNLPFGTRLRVTNESNGRSVVIRSSPSSTRTRFMRRWWQR